MRFIQLRLAHHMYTLQQWQLCQENIIGIDKTVVYFVVGMQIADVCSLRVLEKNQHFSGYLCCTSNDINQLWIIDITGYPSPCTQVQFVDPRISIRDQFFS